MGYVKNMSRAVFGHAGPQELWEEIVSHIPDEVLLKKDVRILNVACGHATETKAIMRRMLALGRTKEEIRNAIVLNDKYSCFTHPWYAQGFEVVTGDFLEWETNMKFDVVIGNPPYQEGKNKLLYRSFMKRAEELSDLVVFIVPNFATYTNSLGIPKNIRYYKDMGTRAFKIQLPSGTCYYIQDKKYNAKQIEFIDHSGNSVMVPYEAFFLVKDAHVLKILSEYTESLSVRYYHGTKPPDASVSKKRYSYLDKVGNDTQPASYVYSDAKSSSEIFDAWKVVIAYNAPGSKFENKRLGTAKVVGPNLGITDSVICLTVNSKEEGENLVSFLNTKLVRFIIQSCKYATNNSKTLFSLLPNIQLDVEWSDKNVYDYWIQHFQLSDVIIAHIENKIK